MEIILDDVEVHILHVGPCHQVGDTIVWMPKERVLFAGDVLFRMCTPMGWVGTFEKWFETLDMIVDEFKPDVIVPGHGPVCGVEEHVGKGHVTSAITDFVAIFINRGG